MMRVSGLILVALGATNAMIIGESLAVAAQDEFCLHEVDTEDHKCLEACAATKFAQVGVNQTDKCPAEFSTVDSQHVVLQCPDGVTNLRYCPDTAMNVTVTMKGEDEMVARKALMTFAVRDEYCLHEVDTEDHKCLEACAATKFAQVGVTQADKCPQEFSTVDSEHVVLQCPDGVTNLRYCPDTEMNVTVTMKGEEEMVAHKALMTFAVRDEYCLHEVDTEDHKCLEACAATKFAQVGVTQADKCPQEFSTVDNEHVVLQCPDGVTNLRYCPDTAMNVTVTMKGEEEMVALKALMTYAVLDEFCLHEVDTEDHKCIEACAATNFAQVGVNQTGKCPAEFGTVDSQKVVLQCPDGVTNLRYCPDTEMNVTVTMKGEDEMVVRKALMTFAVLDEFCLHEVDTEDHKCIEACAATKFAQVGVNQSGKCPAEFGTVDSQKIVLQCPDGVTNLRYCPDATMNVTVTMKGEDAVLVMVSFADQFCLHSVDTEDHKCLEACAATTFAEVGVKEKDGCPSQFNTVDSRHVFLQCPDGVTNLRYCPDTALNVTVTIKGEN